MMYLEDFLETAEGLPSEIRSKLNEIRMLDEKAEKMKMYCLERREKAFKSLHASKNSQVDQKILDQVRKDLMKITDMHRKKKELADNMGSLLDRYIRKLDLEQHKFKCELEADNPGITRIIESRFENSSGNLHGNSLKIKQPLGGAADRRRFSENPRSIQHTLPVKIKQEVVMPKRNSADLSIFNQVEFDSESPIQKITLNTNLPHHSTAHAVTSEPCHVKFTPSAPLLSNNFPEPFSDFDLKQDDVKLSDWNSPSSVFDLPIQGHHHHNQGQGQKTHFPFNQPKKDSQQDLMQGDALDTSGNDSMLSGDMSVRPSRTKIKTSRAAAWEQERLQSSSGRSHRKRDQSASDGDEDTKNREETGEKTYCVCNQVSFGNMIACEYEGCSIEWFHYECVGITEAPKGKWYCNECSKSANVLTMQDDKKDKRRHYR